MATGKFAFAQNQQLQQHCCVFIICFLTFLVCKIWWFSFCSLQSHTPTWLFHHSQAFRGQTYSWIFVCTWGVFLHKLGVFRKRLRKSSGRNIAYFFQLMVSLKQPFSTSFKHVTQLPDGFEHEKQRGLFPTQMWQKSFSWLALAWEKCDAPTRLKQLFLSFRKDLLEKLSCFQMHLLHFETPYFLG